MDEKLCVRERMGYVWVFGDFRERKKSEKRKSPKRAGKTRWKREKIKILRGNAPLLFTSPFSLTHLLQYPPFHPVSEWLASFWHKR